VTARWRAGVARHPGRARAAAAVLGPLLLVSCSSTTTPSAGPSVAPSASGTTPTAAPDETRSPSAEQRPVDPISLEALDRADLVGSDLRLGPVRARTPGLTSYDVSFRSTTAGRGTRPLRITGVLDVPDGRGPFPAVVMAHGYIDPAVYERGQGMTRERGYLASRGFVALHVDYRNHAGSDDDPRVDTAVRLGYVTDVVAAARALQRSDDVQVDPERIALFGRSMGGGVMLKALTVEPGLFSAGVGWASVSSLEAENFQHFIARDTSRAELRAEVRRRHGLPEDDPGFWRGLSPRPRFDEIREPVLMVHGRFDDTCPPPWAQRTHRALLAADVDATLEWYDDGHAFGPAFNAAMDRTVRFLRRAS
jgi:uncharacterized protein